MALIIAYRWQIGIITLVIWSKDLAGSKRFEVLFTDCLLKLIGWTIPRQDARPACLAGIYGSGGRLCPHVICFNSKLWASDEKAKKDTGRDGRHNELSLFVNITPRPYAIYSNLKEVLMNLINQS